MTRHAWIAIALGALLVAGVFGPMLVSRDEASEVGTNTAEVGEARGEPAPTIYFETLEGSSASLLDYAGRVVVFNIWGTWCAPCRYEIPELAELHSAYEDRGAIVIGLAIDSGDPAQIRAFAERYGVNYPIWTSTGAIAVSEFGAVGYPFTLVVDQDGRTRNRYLGPQTFSTLAAELDVLLSAPVGAPGTPESGS
jgi:thiol-disulfide isomerase/thioredoxin